MNGTEFAQELIEYGKAASMGAVDIGSLSYAYEHVFKSMGYNTTPPTWAGRCSLCKGISLTHEEPHLTSSKKMCQGSPDKDPPFRSCIGALLRLPNMEAVIAAYQLGGWDAVHAMES